VREKIPQIEATKPDEGKVAVSKKTKEDYVAGSPQEEESNEEGGVDEENPTKKDDDNDDDASDSHPTVDEKEVDDVCAICIEHFRKYFRVVKLRSHNTSLVSHTTTIISDHIIYVTEQDEFVMEGLECHHEYHRSCMMEWLHKHNDCPVCRKGMWTRDAFVAAKKQVLKANPKLVKAEMEAAQAVEDTMETAAAGDSAGDDNDQEHDEESPNSTATSAPATPGVL
jgi:hypothetical protein